MAFILAAWGCQSTPPAADRDAAATDVEQAAAPDSPQGLLDAAAAASGVRADRLYLDAAEALIALGDFAAARRALDAIDLDRLRARDTARFLLARADEALNRGDTETARAALLALDAERLPDPTAAVLSSAELLAREGRPAAAAGYLMDYRPGTPGGPLQQQLNDRIWSYLGQVPPFQTLTMERRTTGTARGWWQLKDLMFRSFTLDEQRRRLATWRESRPDHPAARQPPAALLALEVRTSPVTRVGLMLPLSGPLGRAGRAVRDAFVATYLSHRDEVGFEVAIYDAAAEPVASLYERALVQNTDLLIGPLAKESVAQINQLNPEIPVLALNYLGDEEMPAPNLLQLGLAIEDEAVTLEQWLRDEQVERLLLLHNDEDWAMRAMQSVVGEWPGRLTVQAIEDIRTMTESVGVAMHVAASQQRHGELEQLLGDALEFQPRARGDVDAILALVTQLEASALVPALRFHYADKVPVYATSQTIRGASASRLQELAGFRISELPWNALGEASYRELDEAFGLEGSPFVALYALGVDAFRLAERLPLILDGAFTELLGSTGELEFTPDGRIRRRLARSIVADGQVRAVAALPASGATGKPGAAR